jgi:hypothetical protein
MTPLIFSRRNNFPEANASIGRFVNELRQHAISYHLCRMLAAVTPIGRGSFGASGFANCSETSNECFHCDFASRAL